MSSADSDQPELKGNHAPAEKMSGGVRIARKGRPSESDKVESNDDMIDAGEGGEITSTANEIAIQKQEKQHREEGVRATHEKPHPTHEPNHQYSGQAHKDASFQPRITQPRKQ